jgi:hypothetical protein
VRYDSIRKEAYANVNISIHFGRITPKLWGPGLQPAKHIGQSGTILQGELFDNIVNALCVLEKTNVIDLHRTVAFAKNKREFRGRFKLSNEKVDIWTEGARHLLVQEPDIS